jgi:hypothetical protein
MFTKKIPIIISILVIVLQSLLTQKAFADAVTTMKLNGEEAVFTLPASDASTKITFWAKSDGNQTMPFGARVIAPSGAKVQLFFGGIPKKAPASIDGVRVWSNLGLRVGSAKEKTKFTIPQAAAFATTYQTSSSTTSNSEICDSLSDSDIAALCPLLASVITGPCNRAAVCAYIESQIPGGSGGGGPGGGGVIPGSGGGIPTGNYGELEGYGLVHKNACDGNTKSYIIKIEIDLSAVDRSQYPNGVQFSTAAQVVPYRGCKSASIKPTSDGKFAPNPLILMCSLGGFEGVSLANWKSGKYMGGQNLKVEDYIYHKGVYTRSVASKVLRGGRGTFEISNGGSAYGVCFSLSRTRQRANGYPS